MAYKQAYPKTKAGVIEIKEIPSSVVMEASGKSNTNYFKDQGGSSSFMKLFRYIQSNGIPMTTPVEVNVDKNQMRFYATSASRTMQDSQDVEVKKVNTRQVLSIGVKGSYNQENYTKAEVKLREWLTKNPQWQIVDESYAVYWDSPYVLFFLKHSEVHVPVRKK